MENDVLGMFPFAIIPGHQMSITEGHEYSGSAHGVYRMLQVWKIKTCR